MVGAIGQYRDDAIALFWFSAGLLLLAYGLFDVPQLQFLENGIVLLVLGIGLLLSGVLSLRTETRSDEP